MHISTTEPCMFGNSIRDVIIGNVLAYRPESAKSGDSPSNPLNPLIRCGQMAVRLRPFLCISRYTPLLDTLIYRP
jgi:hypothetical protein